MSRARRLDRAICWVRVFHSSSFVILPLFCRLMRSVLRTVADAQTAEHYFPQEIITRSPTLRPVGSAPFWQEMPISVGEKWKSLYTFFGFSPANTATANKGTKDAAKPIIVALIVFLPWS